MEYPFFNILDTNSRKTRNKALVIAEYVVGSGFETELDIFAVIDFRTTEINCSEYEAENRLERRDFVSVKNPKLFGSRNALGENLASILYQESDTDMFYQVPAPIYITKYIDLKSFLISVGREDIAAKPYLSNKDINKIIAFVKANKEELGFGSMQR